MLSVAAWKMLRHFVNDLTMSSGTCETWRGLFKAMERFMFLVRHFGIRDKPIIAVGGSSDPRFPIGW